MLQREAQENRLAAEMAVVVEGEEDEEERGVGGEDFASFCRPFSSEEEMIAVKFQGSGAFTESFYIQKALN
eukprot:Cvel_6548.t2-p1 / transcript=Cvel_6548.t2 / gene=Cvel_6548 / organism=Chromera_velia_CCMP2878 / gene_product=hypothetical protein / transcript_product=hypothetical protein / location=Cvel_scaffold322:55553-55762(-) / protein_length=70 / sequence_SO=supercontig / SO=protein_coding / is_pseudo=false